MDPQIAYLLSCVAKRFRSVQFARLMAAVWLLTTVAAIVMMQLGSLPTLGMVSLFVAAGVIALVWLASKLAYRDERWIATKIEEKFPTLKQRLVTAIQPEQPSTSRFLKKSLIDETIDHSRANDWQQ